MSRNHCNPVSSFLSKTKSASICWTRFRNHQKPSLDSPGLGLAGGIMANLRSRLLITMGNTARPGFTRYSIGLYTWSRKRRLHCNYGSKINVDEPQCLPSHILFWSLFCIAALKCTRVLLLKEMSSPYRPKLVLNVFFVCLHWVCWYHTFSQCSLSLVKGLSEQCAAALEFVTFNWISPS